MRARAYLAMIRPWVVLGGVACSTAHNGGASDDAGDPSGTAIDAPRSIDSALVPGDAALIDASPVDARPVDARPVDAGACESPNLGTRTAPPFGAPTITTSGLLVRVMNNCSFPLWISGSGNAGGNVLQPDQAKLDPGGERDYDAHTSFSSARVTAFKNGPDQNEYQFVEMNFGNGQLGYNISYVDYIAVPVEVDAACGLTACYAPAATLLEGCPTQLRESDRCRSPGGWCINHAGDPYCKVLDQTATAALGLAKCKSDLNSWLAGGGSQNNIGTTPSVYGCRDFWASSPYCCAIVNRGMVAAADPYAVCHFYETTPYNTYARWVHQQCPGIYAFPYDDAGEQGGYHQCATREVRITWCPGG